MAQENTPTEECASTVVAGTDSSPQSHLKIVDDKPVEADAFKVTVSAIQRSPKDGRVFSGADAGAVLTDVLRADVSDIEEPNIKWSDDAAALAIDIDVPKGDSGLAKRRDIARLFPETLPLPLAAWVTHGGGLRAIFVATAGRDAKALAGAWSLLAPLGHMAGWRMEPLRNTRHPSGLRNGQSCGDVRWFNPSSNLRLPSDAQAGVTAEQIESFMAERGIQFGRTSTEGCLICHKADATSRNDVILIGEDKVKCFRCDKSETWSHIIGGPARGSLRDAAWHLVHFPHQRFVLSDMRPSVPDELLKPAWEFFLDVANESWLAAADSDEVEDRREILRTAAGTGVDLVRGVSGGWYDAATLEPRIVSASSAKTFPYAAKGISPILVDKLMGTGTLVGFTPTHIVPAEVVLGPFVAPPDGSVLARMPLPPSAAPPFQLTNEPPSADIVEAAWKTAIALLPGLSRGYLSAIITSIWVAQRASALPPVLVATGDTGAAKTTAQDLAAAMVGSFAVGVTLDEKAEATFRQIGLAIERGAACLFVDEVGRIPGVYHRLEAILRLRHTIQFAPKHINERHLPMSAPISLLGSTLPSAVTKGPELSRRSVGFRILEEAINWRSVGNLAHARKIESLRPALDTITSALWWQLYAEGTDVDWRRLCFEKFGAVALEQLDILDDDAGVSRAIRALYRHYRSAPDAAFTTGNRHAGWLDASSGKKPADALVADLVDVEGDKRGVIAETEDLKRRKLGPILGFEKPILKLSIRKRGGLVLAKFVEIGVVRGRETRRQDLPPLGTAPDGIGDSVAAQPSRTPTRLGKSASPRVTHVAHDTHSQSLSEKQRSSTAADDSDDEDDEEDGAASSCVTCATRPDAGLTTAPSTRNGRPNLIFLDFETRSLADLPRVGGRIYAEHPSTEVLCLAAVLPDKSCLDWTPADGSPTELLRWVENGAHVIAHNGIDFDRHIWRRQGWPEPTRWVDTLHLARLAGLPGKLEDIAYILFGETKDKQGKKALAELNRIDPRTGKLPRVDQTRLRLVRRYCMKDVLLMRRAWKARLRYFSRFDKAAIAVDEKINSRGFAFDADLAGNLIKIAGSLQTDAENAAPVGGDVLRSAKKLKAALADARVHVLDTKEDTLVALLDDEELPADIRRIIEAKTLNAKRLRQKLERGLDSVSADGRIRDTLNYHGAHTGRWAGRRFQPHNLAKGKKLKDEAAAIAAVTSQDIDALRALAAELGCKPEDVLDSLIRRCIVAPVGEPLIVADYSAIEPRGLAWLVDDEAKLAAFRGKEDLYMVLAADLFGVPYEKVTEEQRACGKVSELGCGYQMGAPRFELYGEGFGINWNTLSISPKDVIDGWRDRNPLVAGTRTGNAFNGHYARAGGLWKDVHAAFENVTRHRGAIALGRLIVKAVGGDVHCVLPSGRPLVYRDMRMEPGKTQWGRTQLQLTYAGARGRTTTYGGKITENIVQAICRDVLADALVRLEDIAGATTVLHVHDEVVLEAKAEAIEQTVKQVEAVMCTPPSWAPDFPIAVKPFTCARYRKD